jgi:hypothetical protein
MSEGNLWRPSRTEHVLSHAIGSKLVGDILAKLQARLDYSRVSKDSGNSRALRNKIT